MRGPDLRLKALQHYTSRSVHVNLYEMNLYERIQSSNLQFVTHKHTSTNVPKVPMCKTVNLSAIIVHHSLIRVQWGQALQYCVFR